MLTCKPADTDGNLEKLNADTLSKKWHS